VIEELPLTHPKNCIIVWGDAHWVTHQYPSSRLLFICPETHIDDVSPTYFANAYKSPVLLFSS
jgi:hypothetical protein